MMGVSLLTHAEPQSVGRYALFDVIASGGMAAVHLGRMIGQVGFARTVAIKRLHANFASDPEFVAMLMDEARLAARIRHPNVVPTLDIVAEGREVLLVMEYVAGASLMQLLNAARTARSPVAIPIICDIVVGVLNGLHAAHEATDEQGLPLHIVHRDVSPHNVLVGTDGVPRVLDFGIAKAVGRSHQTRGSQIKGKLRYMPAEQMLSQKITPATDVYSTAVVLWEALTNQRLFDGENDAQVMYRVLNGGWQRPSELRPEVSPELDDIVARGLNRDPTARFPTAKAMAQAIEAAVPPVKRSAVSDWVIAVAGDQIGEREAHVAQVERSSRSGEQQAISDSSLRAISARPEQSTVSRVGSVSRSVSPGSSRSSQVNWRGISRVMVGASLVLLLGGGIVWAMFAAPPPESAPRAAVLSEPVAASPMPSAATPAVVPTPPVPSPALEVTSAAPSAAPAAKKPLKGIAKAVRPPAPAPKAASVPSASARIYRRD